MLGYALLGINFYAIVSGYVGVRYKSLRWSRDEVCIRSVLCSSLPFPSPLALLFLSFSLSSFLYLFFFFPSSFPFFSSPSLCPRFGDKFLNFSEATSAFRTVDVWGSGCCRLCAYFGSNRAVTCSSRSALAFVVQVPLHPSVLFSRLLFVELLHLVICSWMDGSEFPIHLLAAVHFFPTGL